MTFQHLLRGLFIPARRALVIPLLLIVSSLFMVGCDQTGQLTDSPYYRPLEESTFFADGRSARPFLPGTVPYMAGDQSPNDPALTGLNETTGEPVEGFPVDVNMELLAYGQERFEIYCVPCHGPAGEGNGRVTGFGFPKPASLLENKNLTSGQIFEIITNGQGDMFPYGYRVKPNARWAIIAYIRALQQRGGAVNVQDLTPEEINKIGNQP